MDFHINSSGVGDQMSMLKFWTILSVTRSKKELDKEWKKERFSFSKVEEKDENGRYKTCKRVLSSHDQNRER